MTKFENLCNVVIDCILVTISWNTNLHAPVNVESILQMNLFA